MCIYNGLKGCVIFNIEFVWTTGRHPPPAEAENQLSVVRIFHPKFIDPARSAYVTISICNGWQAWTIICRISNKRNNVTFCGPLN